MAALRNINQQMKTFKQLIEDIMEIESLQEEFKQLIKKVPLSKNELMWNTLRSYFDLRPSKMTTGIIYDKVDNNETVAQIEYGKNGSIGFVQVDKKIGFAEYVGENVGISRDRMTIEQLNALLKGI